MQQLLNLRGFARVYQLAFSNYFLSQLWNVCLWTECLHTDEFLTLLLVAKYGLARIGKNGGLNLIVNDDGLLNRMHIDVSSLDFPLQISCFFLHDCTVVWPSATVALLQQSGDVDSRGESATDTSAVYKSSTGFPEACESHPQNVSQLCRFATEVPHVLCVDT
eukprot:Opistho-2@91156